MRAAHRNSGGAAGGASTTGARRVITIIDRSCSKKSSASHAAASFIPRGVFEAGRAVALAGAAALLPLLVLLPFALALALLPLAAAALSLAAALCSTAGRGGGACGAAVSGGRQQQGAGRRMPPVKGDTSQPPSGAPPLLVSLPSSLPSKSLSHSLPSSSPSSQSSSSSSSSPSSSSPCGLVTCSGRGAEHGDTGEAGSARIGCSAHAQQQHSPEASRAAHPPPRQPSWTHTQHLQAGQHAAQAQHHARAVHAVQLLPADGERLKGHHAAQHVGGERPAVGGGGRGEGRRGRAMRDGLQQRAGYAQLGSGLRCKSQDTFQGTHSSSSRSWQHERPRNVSCCAVVRCCSACKGGGGTVHGRWGEGMPDAASLAGCLRYASAASRGATQQVLQRGRACGSSATQAARRSRWAR